MKLPTLLIGVALLAGPAWSAQPMNWPRIREGRGLRIVTGAGEVCNGKLKLWRPDALTVLFTEPTACGAANGVLTILPSNVLQISADPNRPWRVLTPPAVAIGGVAGGVRVLAMSTPAGAAVIGGAFAIRRLIRERAPDYSVFLKVDPAR